MPRAWALKMGIKIDKIKWIDIDKGDVDHPVHRSRFVAKEFNNGDEEGLFAATPPLEALRVLVSDAATTHYGIGDKEIMVADVARAFFEAPMQRKLAVELPEEDLEGEEGRGGTVGLLNMSLYGTRDAAANFQREVRKVMTAAGFTQGKYSPCTFWHEKLGIKVLVHGDDFVNAGSREALDWFQKILEDRFEMKHFRMGLREGCIREGRILNRVIRVNENGWEIEADQRHVDLLIRGLSLEQAKGVNTPGEDEKPWEQEEGEEKHPDRSDREYRSLAARVNYLSLDRVDLQFACKEICRGMADPRKRHWRKLRRLGRYLKQYPRGVIQYSWQEGEEDLRVYTDSDWAGCRRTARSTSGGVMMRGTHFLRSWSTTQKNITLTSGEAELVALVK